MHLPPIRRVANTFCCVTQSVSLGFTGGEEMWSMTESLLRDLLGVRFQRKYFGNGSTQLSQRTVN